MYIEQRLESQIKPQRHTYTIQYNTKYTQIDTQKPGVIGDGGQTMYAAICHIIVLAAQSTDEPTAGPTAGRARKDVQWRKRRVGSPDGFAADCASYRYITGNAVE